MFVEGDLARHYCQTRPLPTRILRTSLLVVSWREDRRLQMAGESTSSGEFLFWRRSPSTSNPHPTDKDCNYVPIVQAPVPCMSMY